MIGFDVLCLGLTRLQRQTVLCHFPHGFRFYSVTADDLYSDEDYEIFVSRAWCAFINPKKLRPGQLRRILAAHDRAVRKTHAAILLFTEAFTPEQKAGVDTRELHRTDLRAGQDRTLRDAVAIIRKAALPGWSGMARMRSNVFNDGWYLLDMETTGGDPLVHDVTSLSLSFMADYRIVSTETIYIRQPQPVSARVEEITGISNGMLEQGVSMEQAVEYLNDLPSPSPLILESTGYYLPFLKAMHHACGRQFSLPYVAIDGLASIVFGHTLAMTAKELTATVKRRKYARSPVEQPHLAGLYDLTLAVFENLQDRYDVRAAGDLHRLYYGEVSCGE